MVGLSRGALVRSVVASTLATISMPQACSAAERQWKRVNPIQFIAANVDPTGGGNQQSSGTGADSWGIWTVDPGPRGVQLRDYSKLEKNNGVAPAKWQFENELASWGEDYAAVPSGTQVVPKSPDFDRSWYLPAAVPLGTMYE